MHDTPLTSEEVAAMFKALGDPTRLRIWEFLRACCGPVSIEESGDVRPVQGKTVGEVCCHLTGNERITSTVSFHLKELRQAKLIQIQRSGKNRLCSVEPSVTHQLRDYFDRATGESLCPCEDLP